MKVRKNRTLNTIIKKTKRIDMYFKLDIVSEPLILNVAANSIIENMNHNTEDIKLKKRIILIPFPEVLEKDLKISARKLNHITEKKK